MEHQSNGEYGEQLAGAGLTQRSWFRQENTPDLVPHILKLKVFQTLECTTLRKACLL